MVADGHAGGEIQLLEFGTELAEADAGAVRDLGAAVQVQHLDVPAVLGKGPVQGEEEGKITGELLVVAQEPVNRIIYVQVHDFYAIKSNFYFFVALLHDLKMYLKMYLALMT